MKKLCPNCEKNNPEDAEYCYNCGYKFYTEQNNINNTTNLFRNGKIFLLLIIIILIAGTLIITTTNTTQEINDNNNIHVTITEVKGENYSKNNAPDYSYFTKLILSNLPLNEEDRTIDGLILQTTYYSNSQKIGETKEAMNEMTDLYDYKYDEKTSTSAWTKFFDTTDNRIPSSVTVTIIDENNNIISQDNYTVNEKHVFDI